MRTRTALVTLHLWIGLLVAPTLIVLGCTGAVLVLEDPMLDRLAAAVTVVTPAGSPRSLDEWLASVWRTYPDAKPLGVQLPPDARHTAALTVALPNREPTAVFVDPYTARVLGTDGDQPQFFRRVRQLHRQLLAGNGGALVVAVSALALVVLALTGPFVWWPRRRTGVRWRRRGWRRTLDLHATFGAVSWSFLLAFAITGVIVHWDDATQKLIAAVTGTPSPRPPSTNTPAVCDVPALGLDRLLAAGAGALPGARPTAIQLPRQGQSLARVTLKFPEDHTPNGRSMALIDPCTGVVTFTIDTRRAPLAYLIPREWNREIHTGDIFGWPTRVLALLFSLALPALAITGPVVWLGRRRRRAADRLPALGERIVRPREATAGQLVPGD